MEKGAGEKKKLDEILFWVRQNSAYAWETGGRDTTRTREYAPFRIRFKSRLWPLKRNFWACAEGEENRTKLKTHS